MDSVPTVAHRRGMPSLYVVAMGRREVDKSSLAVKETMDGGHVEDDGINQPNPFVPSHPVR